MEYLNLNNLPEKAIEKISDCRIFQIILAGRTSWGVTNSMLIVSGAFGVVQKTGCNRCGWI